MLSRFAASPALRMPRSVPGAGAVSPRCQAAEISIASKPAWCERSTCARAEAGFRWASESSTVPTRKLRRRGLPGPGGGGIAAVVVGISGDVVPVVLVPVEVEPEPGDPLVEPELEVPGDAGSALPPPPEETITPTIAPAAATIATAAISVAFLTRREATLARNAQPRRRAAETAPGQARGLFVPRRPRTGSLHRQGQIFAAAGAQLFPGEPGFALHDPAPAGARGRRRGDRHRHRSGGPAP